MMLSCQARPAHGNHTGSALRSSLFVCLLSFGIIVIVILLFCIIVIVWYYCYCDFLLLLFVCCLCHCYCYCCFCCCYVLSLLLLLLLLTDLFTTVNSVWTERLQQSIDFDCCFHCFTGALCYWAWLKYC